MFHWGILFYSFVCVFQKKERVQTSLRLELNRNLYLATMIRFLNPAAGKKKETKPYRNKPFLWSYFITCLHSKDLPDKSFVGSPFYIDDCVISRFILLVFKTSKQKHDKALYYGFARPQGDSAAYGFFSCEPEYLYSSNFWLSLRFAFGWTTV